MAEYLDNIYTDEDLASQEFINEINKDLSDITGYEVTYTSTNTDEDPLNEVLKKEVVEVKEIKRTVNDKLTNKEKVQILRKPRTKASIAIDDNGDIVCQSWGNYYICGAENTAETTKIINDYIEECLKPVNERNFDNFNVGKKNVVEKFKDMNLHKGIFDINGFYENVVK